jgi:hypothetical protein
MTRLGQRRLSAPVRQPAQLSMNFFGHAALAASHFGDEHPLPSAGELATLCVGSMLPDFIGMLRLSRPDVRDDVLARGVAFHHKTDEAFHELPRFLRLSRDAFAWLSDSQLPRGPARAVAHIGIEILLDEVFAEREAARVAYLAALRVPLAPLLGFPAAADAERLAALQNALLQRTHAALDAPAELVAERIRRSLAGRPRLAVDDDGQELLARWVTMTRPFVKGAAPEIFAALRLQLAKFGGAK